MKKLFKLSTSAFVLSSFTSALIIGAISALLTIEVPFYRTIALKVDEKSRHVLEVNSDLAYQMKPGQRISIIFNQKAYNFKIRKLENTAENKFDVYLIDLQNTKILLPNSIVTAQVRVNKKHVYELFTI